MRWEAGDCRKFADSRTYDQARLGAGFHAAVEAVRKRSDADESTPVWYGGWSTGAEQSVAAACADRPAHLVGLLLAAPGSHGRYGITTSDLLGKDPEGPGSFALADLAPRKHPLKCCSRLVTHVIRGLGIPIAARRKSR
jgi:hypothetical protein